MMVWREEREKRNRKRKLTWKERGKINDKYCKKLKIKEDKIDEKERLLGWGRKRWKKKMNKWDI